MTPRIAYAGFMILAAAMFLLIRRCFPTAGGLSSLTRQERLVIGLSAFIGGVLGAKLPFVFQRGADWFGSAWLADGKTITTGLIGAYIGVELAKLALGVRVKTGDAFALPLALSLAIGRWGCFFNGCCAGVRTDLPWGVDFGDGVRRHPTQVYESVFHLTIVFALIIIIRHGWLRNQRLKFYLIAYGIFRFLTEFIRPEPVYALGLTYFQFVAIFIVVALSVQWRYDARHQNRGSISAGGAS
jgi:phosphatidylglycerol---prolipoprotein diacylglyceryl transferase